MSEWIDSSRLGPVTINGSATVIPDGSGDPSGTSTNLIIDVRGMGTVVIQTISTTSLAYKFYLSYDGGTTYSPVRSVNAAGTATAADTAVTASTTIADYLMVLGATHLKVSRTAGSGTFQYAAHPDAGAFSAATGVALTTTHGKTLKTYSGTFTADTDVIAAVTAKRIKVFAYSIINIDNTADTVIFKSGGTSGTELWRVYLRGPDANTPYGANLATDCPSFLFATVAGEKLTADVSAAATLHMSLAYWDDDAS